MRHPVIIPNLGMVESVTLIRWSASTGSDVIEGDVLLVIETEKAELEVPAPASGSLAINVEAGPELVPADAILGYVDDRL